MTGEASTVPAFHYTDEADKAIAKAVADKQQKNILSLSEIRPLLDNFYLG